MHWHSKLLKLQDSSQLITWYHWKFASQAAPRHVTITCSIGPRLICSGIQIWSVMQIPFQKIPVAFAWGLAPGVFCVEILNALVICNHGPQPRGGQGIAVEISGALTKVLPRQCGGNARVLPYIGKKGPWNEKIAYVFHHLLINPLLKYIDRRVLTKQLMPCSVTVCDSVWCSPDSPDNCHWNIVWIA